MIIRHEINLLAGIPNPALSGSATAPLSSGSAYYCAYVDVSKYSGTLTAYFEYEQTSTSAFRARLYQLSTGNSIVQGLVNSAAGLYRTGSFTPTTDTYFMYNQSGDGSGTVKAARIIIIQDTGTNALTASESQYEIGNQELAVTVTATGTLQPLAAPKYWQYDASNTDGTKTFYAECTYLVSATTGNKTIVVQEASTPTGTWATAATILSLGSGSTSVTRVRSAAFTPKDGYYYRLAFSNSSTMTTVSIYSAKIILDQTYSTISTNYTVDGSQGITDASSGWTNDASAFDNNTSTFASCSFTSGTTPPVLIGTGTTAPSTGTDSLIQTVYLRATYAQPTGTLSSMAWRVKTGATQLFSTTAGSTTQTTSTFAVALTVPSGGWTWAILNSLTVEIQVNSSTANTGVYNIYTTEIVVITTDVNNPPAKFEEHYLLANTTLAAGTALQNFQTKWDPTEWNGVTNIYVHQIDANASNTSVIELDTAGGTQVVNSPVTSPNVYGISQSLIDSYPTSNYTSQIFGIDNNNLSIGQSFVGTGAIVNYATFYLSKVGSPTYTLTGKLYAVDSVSTYPTTLLATSTNTISASSIATTFTPYTFYFAGYTTTNAAWYAVVIEGSTYGTSTDYIASEASYPGSHVGHLVYFYFNGGVSPGWSSSPGEDLIFYVGSNAITMPTAQNLDVKATTNSGNIFGSRIITTAVKSAVANLRRIFVIR